MRTFPVLAAICGVAMIAFTPGLSAQAPCSATVTQGIFSSSITCSSNTCTSTCSAVGGGVTAGGIAYAWCQCGAEPESECCRVVLLDVWGPDMPAKLGQCGIAGCLDGDCELRLSGWFSTTVRAVCVQLAAPEQP